MIEVSPGYPDNILAITASQIDEASTWIKS